MSRDGDEHDRNKDSIARIERYLSFLPDITASSGDTAGIFNRF